MEFVKFKLPNEIGELSDIGYYLISYITTDHNGFKIAFYNNEDDSYEIVFDFGYAVQDYRVSDEGRRLDYHVSAKITHPWILAEVKDSEYLEKIDKESSGILLAVDPDLKHYITGDQDYVIDIISKAEPKVYKLKSTYKKEE